MKKLALLCLSAFSLSAFAQETANDSTKYWNIGGTTSLTFNSVTLSNWAAGGENSETGTVLFNTHLNYKKDKVSWENLIDFGYGLTKQGTEDYIKSEDKIYLLSKYGYQASKRWYYTGLIDFKSQFDKGYDDPHAESPIKISDLMSPAYVNLSIGMDFKPSDNFSMYISPLTSRFTIVKDKNLSEAGAFGVNPGKTVREEYGAYLKLAAKKTDLVKNVNFSSRLDLFSNLTENPQNIDVDWEVVFDMKINSFLTAIAKFNLFFDDDVAYMEEQTVGDKTVLVERGARVQTKTLIGFGLSYKFGRH